MDTERKNVPVREVKGRRYFAGHGGSLMKGKLLMIGKFLLVLIVLAVASISPSEPDVNATDIEENGKISGATYKPLVFSYDLMENEWEDYTLTAYCSCEKCCGKSDGITASGTIATPGRTVAVDTTNIPYGTTVEIDGFGTYVAEDCGGAIKGNRIDIFFADHEQAMNFGVQRARVRIVKGDND